MRNLATISSRLQFSFLLSHLAHSLLVRRFPVKRRNGPPRGTLGAPPPYPLYTQTMQGVTNFLVLGENRPLAYVEKFRKQFSFVRERISTSSLFLAHLRGQLFELALLLTRYDVRLLAFYADRQIVGIRH